MDIIPLIELLEIRDIFKDKARREGDSIINALSTMLWLLEEELEVAS